MTQLRALLSNRSFLSVWISSIVSGLGDKIAIIALYVLVYNLSGRAVNLGLLAAVQIVPALLVGPLAGLILDRYNRKAVMVWSDLGSAMAVAMLPFARELWHIYLVAALLATGRQFTGPARLAIVVDLVPDRQLEKANALAMITRNLILLVGPAIGGLLVAVWGTSSAFWVDSATFLASAVILMSRRLSYLPRQLVEGEAGVEPTAPTGIPGAAPRNTPGTTPADLAAPGGTPGATPADLVAPAGLRSRWLGAWHDIRLGASLIWQQRRLRFAFFFMSAIVFVTAMQPPLVVFFVKHVLARGDADLGLVLSASGLGGIVGAVGGGMFRSSRRPLRTVTWLLAVDGLLLILFAVGRNFPLALALFALFGAIGTVAQINLATFLQREAPQEKRGRVFGWLGAVMAPLSLASVFVGSLVADTVGVVLVLALSGLFELTVGLVGRFRLPRPQAAADPTGARRETAPPPPPGGSASATTPREVEPPQELAGEA